MVSTREQKANEKRSRQSDVLSDLENMNVILGAFSRNEFDSNHEDRDIAVDLECNEQ